MKEFKIITDILFDYPDLKYMFQYGFYWDDRATNLVLSKTSQTLRTMMDLLAESVYKNCAWTLWYTHVSNSKAKKSARRMIWNNHYRLGQNPWFLNLYGCYGKSGMLNVQKIKKCYKKGNCYSACKLSGDDDNCGYKKLCHIIELKKMFCELAEGSCKKDSIISISNCFKEEILEQYQDVVTSDKQTGQYRLKENTWTREAMSASGIIGSEEEYEAFLNMIRFFANFAPLSVLGGHFLRHLKEESVSPYFFVRNLPLDFPLEQEYIYRVLYAIIHHCSIRYENTEYMPVAIVYGGKDLSGLAEYLYLDAVEVQGEEIGKEIIRLPLECGRYLEVGEERKTEVSISVQACPAEEFQRFEVAFYYNSQTEYLENRRKEGWKQQIVDEKPKVENCEFISPYYPEDTRWNVDIVTYQMESQDVPGFLDFIDSFGDFAKLLSGTRTEYKTETVYREVKQGKAKEYQSLFSLYNSEELIGVINRPLPPREAELEWLLFVLEEYPNLCRIFIGEETLQKIMQKVKAEQSYEGWFDASYYRYGARCRDIEKRMVEKYRNIVHAVKNRHVLHYCYCEEAVKIFPYALEYDVTRHLTGYRNPPINIMCYSLTEKRTINVKYGSKGGDGGYLQTKNQTLQQNVSFSELDRLYHALSYVIRCGMEEKTQIEDRKLCALIDCLWAPDTRSGVDNYNRCIRKRLNRNRDYVSEFEKLQAFIVKAGDREGEEYLNQVFSYWKDQREWSPVQKQYQTMLLVCFRQGYERLHTPKSRPKVQQCLEQISDMELWQLICGDEIDGVPNEIAFYNEKLNNAVVSFVIKRADNGVVDRVYRLFRNFLCNGEILADNRIRFTVTYERFYYRKIHMLLMVIADLVEELEPAEVEEVIALRKKNKEEQKV